MTGYTRTILSPVKVVPTEMPGDHIMVDAMDRYVCQGPGWALHEITTLLNKEVSAFASSP